MIQKKISKVRAGFTLIELLVVIAIIAVLAVVVVLTLNPAQLLEQSRDSNRISDMATIKSAIGFYLEDVATPTIGTTGECYEDGETLPNGTTQATNPCPWFATAPGTSFVLSTSTRTTNSAGGWIPINLSLISVGAPISSWPVDPLNTVNASGTFVDATSHFYSYAASTTGLVYKIDANMESAKYSAGGTADVESTDGGPSTTTYEQGSNLQL